MAIKDTLSHKAIKHFIKNVLFKKIIEIIMYYIITDQLNNYIHKIHNNNLQITFHVYSFFFLILSLRTSV